MAAKPKQDSTNQVEAEKPKATRKTLTTAERIAKAEADLAAIKAKAAAKEDKARDEAREKRAKLVVKRNALNEQIHAFDDVLGDDVDVPTPTEADEV